MSKLLVLGIILSLLGACTTTTVKVTTPDDPERASELNAKLGLGYMQKGQYRRALQKLEKAIRFNPDNAQAYHYKAELHRRLKEFDKAEGYYKQSLELNPKDADTLNNYGVFLCDQEKYEMAYEHFDRILKDPLYAFKADAYENVGLCAHRQGNLQKAEQAFKQALAINKKTPKSLIKMAQISFDRNRKTEAYDYFKRYLTVSHHTPESLWIGILLENERGGKNAIASYKVLLKGKFPDSKETELLKKLEAQGKI